MPAIEVVGRVGSEGPDLSRKKLTAKPKSANGTAIATNSIATTKKLCSAQACASPAARPTKTTSKLSKRPITPGFSAASFTPNSNPSPSSRTRSSPPSSAPRSSTSSRNPARPLRPALPRRNLPHPRCAPHPTQPPDGSLFTDVVQLHYNVVHEDRSL